MVSESGQYRIPHLNAIFQGILNISNDASFTVSKECVKEYTIEIDGMPYYVCDLQNPAALKVTGGNMMITLVQAYRVTLTTVEERPSTCTQVVSPFGLTGVDSIGYKLLSFS